MTILHPCCGGSLQKGTKLIAVIDIVLSVAASCFVWFMILLTLFYGSELRDALDKDRAEFTDLATLYDLGSAWVVFIFTLYLLLSFIHVLLGRMLLHGAKDRNPERIQRWYSITLCLLVVRLLFYLGGAILSADTVVMPMFGLFGLFYQLYCLWVVRLFRQELVSGTGEASRLRDSFYVVHNKL